MKQERCYRDEPAWDIHGDIIDFPVANNNSASFKFKQKIIGQTGNRQHKRRQNNGSIKIFK